MKIKLIFLGLCLLPFFLISVYNQPAVDDFWSANIIREYGRMGAIKYLYQHISGRFFSNFLMSLLNTLPNGEIWMFKAWPVFIFLSLIASFYFFYHALFQNILTGSQQFMAAVFFVVIYLSTTRTLFEELYWMSSTICYQVAICVFVIGTGSLVRCAKSPSLLIGSLAVICCLLLPGTVESIVPVYLLTLLIILFISLKQKKPILLTCICIALALIAFAFALHSHGNYARMQSDSHSYEQNMLHAVYYSARSVVYYSLIWISRPIIVAAFIIILPVLQKLSKQIIIPPAITFHPFVLLLVSFLFCVIVYLPVTYFESAIPFPRVTTIVFFIAAHLAVFIVFILLKNNWIGRQIAYLHTIKNFRLFAWIFFFCSAFTTRNFIVITKDIVQGNAYEYNREAISRYKTIAEAKSDTCYVPLYVHWPFFAHYAKTEMENSNLFVHMNRYFGKKILYETSKK